MSWKKESRTHPHSEVLIQRMILFIVPDRWHGDYRNDVVESMKENKMDRTFPGGRHGGDIRALSITGLYKRFRLHCHLAHTDAGEWYSLILIMVMPLPTTTRWIHGMEPSMITKNCRLRCVKGGWNWFWWGAESYRQQLLVDVWFAV